MDDSNTQIDDAELEAIQARVDAAWPGPWTAYVEGRDVESGSHFIRVADSAGQDEYPDIWMAPQWTHNPDDPFKDPGPEERQVWFEAHYDFVAHARQDIPRLLAEVRRLRQQVRDQG